MPQLDKPHRFEIDRFREGFLLMLWGYFLKIVIADRIAIVVDTVYENVELYPGLYQVMAAGLFAFQIYCDFGGYSTIAIGSAKILGIDIMGNFDSPYLGTTVTDFWRRWHISLTTWFKDYLYIPLGGNRKGNLRKHLNKLFVFAISGLCHGAEWSFVVWGILNGLYQIIGEVLMPIRLRFRSILKIKPGLLYKTLCIIVTFSLIDFSWIFFRAKDVREAFRVEADSFRMMVFCILILIVTDILHFNNISIRQRIMKQNLLTRSSIVIFSILFILIFGTWGPAFDIANFIYFQF